MKLSGDKTAIPAWRVATGAYAMGGFARNAARVAMLLIVTSMSALWLCSWPVRWIDSPVAMASSSGASDMRDYPFLSVARPTLTPSSEFGGLPVIYAGAGDGSWPDQMEPNDGADDLLGPAPVDVGTLYRNLNLLPRTQPAPNPTPGEDRDWYVWSASRGQCYRAFTGDVAGSSGQLTGKGRVQHAIRMWWYTPVKEGRKLLAEYNPSMGPAEGGYFAAARACAGVDGLMAAEVFNYAYALKYPRGSTYTFGVLDAGVPGDAGPTQPASSQGAAVHSGPGTGPGTGPAVSVPAPRLPPQAPVPTAAPTSTPPPLRTSTLVPSSPTPTATASPSPSPSRSPSPQPGSDGLPARVDVVAYLDQNQNGAPDPGEGLRGLRVALLSVRTNSLQQTVSTDSNGHARLDWTWAGRVRVSLPDLNWSDLVEPYSMESASRPRSDVWSVAQDGGLYLEVRVLSAALPAVIP